MKILTDFSRIFVGALFIVSGFIKANDPMGFGYKLNDYFAPDVLNMPIFDPWALELSTFICIIEIVLGVAVLTGAKSKLVSWSLMLMIIFFTFLTFYSAYYNKVTDCGCFGDALKFTPWQSFTKDLVLFVFISVLFIERRNIKPNEGMQDLVYLGLGLLGIAAFSELVINWSLPWMFSLGVFLAVIVIRRFMKGELKEWFAVGAATVASAWFAIHCINHLPVEDFRPYAEGKSISEGMTIPEGESAPEYGVIYTMVHKQNGETKEVNSKDYITSRIWEDENWEITETSDPILLKEGYEPPVHDFVLLDDDGYDATLDILAEKPIVLAVSYDLEKSSLEGQAKVTEMAKALAADGVYFYHLTASLKDARDKIGAQTELAGPFLTADATMLKTTVRSIPGVMILDEGRVVEKWHHNDLPSYEEIKPYLGR
jgi:uncharacterized membrane protein YphA (DoxX/SURF4 family)